VSVNKFRPHVVVIPEDRADSELANGFQQHYAVNFRAIDIKPEAGGWQHVLDKFESDFVQYLRNYREGHVVMLIDFDEKGEARRSKCEQRIPDDLKSRVFVIGTSDTPEDLKKELNLTFEQIGEALAQDCSREDLGRWGHPHLVHNRAELQRMASIIKPIIFPGN
jgi:hypothetical protein